MKLFQEIRGFSEISRRHPSPKSPLLYAIQLRTHMYETSHPRRRLIIAVDLKNTPDIPHPVKITHIPNPSPAETAFPALQA